ncbi:docking protein 3-like [Haliotis rubra]|uniref:docking protein 3-like n=1 Tax=Haliotis rubra TaxID=36100 RepID=UPI001EE573A2|nr:docking protein 3-like [Haliotis rubra]XP_046575533.1 docking protein 3-like [Haliotis rubra]
MIMDKEKGNKFRVVFSENQPGLSLTNQQQQPYHLVIDNDAVRLRDLTSNDLILEWPYNYVRRYGTSPNKFTVEVGRKSATGEGTFEMETTEGLAILDKIHEVSKQILAKRGAKKPTIPKIDNVYTEPYTQLPMRPRDNKLKGEVPDEKSKESLAANTAAPCFETGDGVTVTRIGQGSKPAESPRLEPPVPPRLEPRVSSTLEPPLPPRLEPRVSSRLEPPLPPRLEPEQTGSEPPVPLRLEPPGPPRTETRTLTGTAPRNRTESDPRARTGSETDLYLSPTVMESVGVNKDDGGVVPRVGATPTPHTCDDEEKGNYWTSTSKEPRTRYRYERLKISDDDSRRQVDPKPAPGKLVVF